MPMSHTHGRLHEHTFNLELAKALTHSNARWHAHADEYILPERPGTLDHGRADILIEDPQMPAAAIEASFDATDADRDAQAKLGRTTTKTARTVRAVLAVHIPEKWRDLAGSTVGVRLKTGRQPIGYALHQLGTSDETRRRWPASGFIQGSVHDAGCLIVAAAMPREFIESRAEAVAQLVEGSASVLNSRLGPKAKRKVADIVGQHSLLEGLRTTVVLWLNSLLTQQLLQVQGVEDIPPVRAKLSDRPNPLEQIRVWKRIINRNWRSVFEPAVRALDVCGALSNVATTEALIPLIEAVGVIEDAHLGQHINIGAELFPILASDRKQSAAFYTRPATAEMLAALAIRQSDRSDSDWAQSNLLRRSVIADMACGTGTLLRAGYMRVQEQHERAGGVQKTVAELHQGAMEFGLRGTDISPIAAHLTSSSLANIGTGQAYGSTQIGWVKVGGVDAETGALEYFSGSIAEDLFGLSHGRAGGTESETTSVALLHNSVDWILMNPPYSRTRGGQSAFDLTGLTTRDRKRCQKRWAMLVKSEPAQLRAGMAASFLALANHKVKRGSGRIGFVLPLTCAFADTWRPTREMIESDFRDIVVVATASGASLQLSSFSADTGMEEMLLVATRRMNRRKDAHATLRCVTLYEPCTRNGEAREIARAIEVAQSRCQTARSTCPITVGTKEIGCITSMETAGDGSPWNMVGVAHGGLALAADALTRGRLDHIVRESTTLGLRMGTIEDVLEVGPTHDLLGHVKGGDPRGAFEFHPVINEIDAIGVDRSLWGANAKRQRSLCVLPTHKGLAPPGVGSEELRARMRATAGRLFYARNLRWTSQALVVAATEQPMLGGRSWTALSHSDTRVEKAFSLWSNSTFGMILHWTQGQRTQNGRSPTQIGALRKIPCPRFDELSEPALDLAGQFFDTLCEQELLPMKDASRDPVRKDVDAAVVKVLQVHNRHSRMIQGTPDSDVVFARRLDDAAHVLRPVWCSEPSVHGWKQS